MICNFRYKEYYFTVNNFFIYFYTLSHDRAMGDVLSLEFDNRGIHSNVEINNIGLVLPNTNNMQFRSWWARERENKWRQTCWLKITLKPWTSFSHPPSLRLSIIIAFVCPSFPTWNPPTIYLQMGQSQIYS